MSGRPKSSSGRPKSSGRRHQHRDTETAEEKALPDDQRPITPLRTEAEKREAEVARTRDAADAEADEVQEDKESGEKDEAPTPKRPHSGRPSSHRSRTSAGAEGAGLIEEAEPRPAEEKPPEEEQHQEDEEEPEPEDEGEEGVPLDMRSGVSAVPLRSKANEESSAWVAPAPGVAQLGSEILSSLPLQVLLYYNAQFSLVWLCAEAAVLASKLSSLSDISRIFHGVCYALWLVCEPFRLYLGLAGNTSERVPHLTAFGLITLFPQLPVAIFFLVSAFAAGEMMRYDVAINLIAPFFIIPELVFCVVAMRRFARAQTAAFYMQFQRRQAEGESSEALDTPKPL